MPEMMNEKLEVKQSNLFSFWHPLKHRGLTTELSTWTLRAFIKCLCQGVEIQRGGKAWVQPSRRTLPGICSLSIWPWGTRYLESVAAHSCSQDQIRNRKRSFVIWFECWNITHSLVSSVCWFWKIWFFLKKKKSSAIQKLLKPYSSIPCVLDSNS